MKTFVLKVALREEEDGRWSASISSLPGCSSWGYSRQEALDNIRDAVEIYIEDMIDAGEGLPQSHETKKRPKLNFTVEILMPIYTTRWRNDYKLKTCQAGM